MQILVKSLRRAPGGGIHYDAAGRRYGGGQFIPAALWAEEKRKAEAALPSLLEAFEDRTQLLRSVFEQNVALSKVVGLHVPLVPLEAIGEQLESSVRESYARAFLLGKRAAGNLFSATAEEQQAVQRITVDELTYLRGFLANIEDGAGVVPYSIRMGYYANALNEPYWLGFVMANRRTDRYLVWDVGETEHCDDCLRFHNGGRPWRADVFWREVASRGFLPRSGALTCRGIRCGCSLREAV